jgi:hypothetical protein
VLKSNQSRLNGVSFGKIPAIVMASFLTNQNISSKKIRENALPARAVKRALIVAVGQRWLAGSSGLLRWRQAPSCRRLHSINENYGVLLF